MPSNPQPITCPVDHDPICPDHRSCTMMRLPSSQKACGVSREEEALYELLEQGSSVHSVTIRSSRTCSSGCEWTHSCNLLFVSYHSSSKSLMLKDAKGATYSIPYDATIAFVPRS